MERDATKRKSTQELSTEVSDAKYRKIRPQATSNDFENTQRCTITERIVSLWKTGSGLPFIATQESKDIMRLQEFESKYMETDKIIQSMKKKLISSEENVAELNILLKREAAEKQSLVTKMSTTWELIANISQHINYITENLDRFQAQTNDLSLKYNNVILKLRNENQKLNTELEQLLNSRQTAVNETEQWLKDEEAKCNELKIKYEILENQVLREKEETQKVFHELEDTKKKLLEMEMIEKTLRVTIDELENIMIIEKDKLKQFNITEEKKCDEIRNRYELKVYELHKNIEENEKKLQEVEENRVEITKVLEEKNKLMEKQEEEVNLYQKQVRELMGQLTDTGLNFQCVKKEKADLEKQLQATRSELTQFQQELETMTMEKRKLTTEIIKLNESLEKEAKERRELSADLTQNKIQLQELINRNIDMNKHLHQNQEGKEREIKTLHTEIQNLKKKLEQILTEKIAEIQIRNELERKYENDMKIQREKYDKCLLDLNTLSHSVENATKEESSIESELFKIRTEKEKLQIQFLNEKITIEEKLNKSEELLMKKIDEENKLKEKLSELQIELTLAKKKYRDLETLKDNKITTLENQLSNFGLSTVTQFTPVQSQKNIAKTIKNIRICKEEIITTGKVKSILKPHVNSYSPKSPAKVSPKKISFNFESDSSDDPVDMHHQNPVLSCEDKFNTLMKTKSFPSMMKLKVSQSSNPEIPKANKFFKSRGNS